MEGIFSYHGPVRPVTFPRQRAPSSIRGHFIFWRAVHVLSKRLACVFEHTFNFSGHILGVSKKILPSCGSLNKNVPHGSYIGILSYEGVTLFDRIRLEGSEDVALLEEVCP